MNLGMPELLIILAILLLVFGPKRLPGLGRSLGNGLRELRGSLATRSGGDEAVEAAGENERKPAEIASGPPSA